jgi:glucose/arabinose dehydrogenase
MESPAALSPGLWYHVAGVYDGVQLRLYINGTLVGSLTATVVPLNGNGSLKLGARGNDASFPFNGLIDEARVTASALYGADFTPDPHPIAVAGTRGLWKFDAQNANDSSSSGNHGTLLGGATFSTDVPPPAAPAPTPTPGTLPAGFGAVPVASGISNPTAMAFAPDGRLFVCLQSGQLRVISSVGSLLPTPFVSVTVNSSGERGLLGVTFDPNFVTNQYVYIYYTATTPAIHNRVSRFTANGDVALVGSEVVILDLNNLSAATNHNGGAIHFGPDNKLYIAAGENATPSNSQTLNNLLGKLLRINADGTIPTDNPFFSVASGNNRAIWALGLRNPYTFAFQRGTGRLLINDVGQVTWEEINDGVAGSNYGWSLCEGICGNPNYRDPIFQYGHGTGVSTGCAITGGAFYNPGVVPYPSDYLGKFFYGDYCSGWIRRFDPGTNTATAFATGLSLPVDLRIGPDGNLYYLARGGGGIVRKVIYTG